MRATSMDRRPGATRPAGVSVPGLSRDERIAIAAARMTGQARPGPVTGPISAVLSALRPGMATRGWMRRAEIVLSIITLPFFLTSVVGLWLFVERWGRVGVFDWLFGAVSGTFLLYAVLYMAGARGVPIHVLVGAMLGAWTARGILRFVAAMQAQNRNG